MSADHFDPETYGPAAPHAPRALSPVTDAEALTTPPAAAPAAVDWAPEEVVRSCSSALHRLDGRSLPSLAVTSALRGEGRSTIAAAAATVMRNDYGRRTVLLELDLERPSLARNLSLNGPGLAEAFRGERPVEDCIQWVDDHLGVLVAGDVHGDAAHISARMLSSALLRGIRSTCDVVVADLPPLPPAGLGDRLAPAFAGVVMVVRAGTTPSRAVTRAVESLATPPAVLLNRRSSRVPRWLRPHGS